MSFGWSRWLGVLLAIFPLVGSAEGFDWSLYRELLAKHVDESYAEGIHYAGVDYRAWAKDPRHQKQKELLDLFDVTDLKSDKQKLAFYINAYNFLAIDLIIQHPDVESIRDIGSWWKPVWGLEYGSIGGQSISLGHIEHDILRQLKEPRIHFAIVCASLSCPDLRKEPYSAENLDFELEEQALAFISNSSKGVRATAEKIQVSKIFDWFEEDFVERGGVIKFISRYKSSLSDGVSDFYYLKYNWSVNHQK
ncbi:MAG: DUF547 domain-containing protein [Kangiellaceae bacterium]|jgi:hypothetical protein|nr:DUF547 domain-containing protein [Kangiellaceae bacterium]|tara:strand:+ start:1559 stop:2308 length:750 start_codon:yes stop_codon:yes gene_type:complete